MAEKGDPWRWVVLMLFCLYSASNAIQWITYSSIATATRDFFNLTTNELNMLSSVYMIVFVVGAYFTCTTFERWGVRLGVLIGCGLNALGSVLKVAPGLQRPSYTTLIIPQTLNSVAQLFVLSTPPLIAAQYFAPHQRTFATAIAATANSLGNAIALFAPPLIVKSANGTTAEFMLLFCLEMGFCVLITVGVFFFLKPPSFQAPSRALLGGLSSAQGSATGVAASQGPAQPQQRLRRRHGEREEEEEMSRIGSDVDSNVNDGSRSDAEMDDAAEEAGVPPRSRPHHTAPSEPISGPGGVAATAAAARPHAVAFADAASTSKPCGGSYSAQEGVVEPTATSYTEFDRGSMSKHKKMTVWRRLRHNEHVITFLEVGHTIYLLFRRRDFVFLLGAFSISMGSVWTYASVLAQILEPFGVAAELAGIIGAVNVVVGTVVSYLVGLWVDRTRYYKYPLLACLVGSVLCCIGLMVIMLKAPKNTGMMNGLCSFIYIFAGVFQNTAIPICFEYAMEISYPLPESVPGALLMAGANLCSLIMLSISSAMLGNGVANPVACVNVLILITCVCFVGAVLAIFPREKLYRRDAELEARQRLAAEACGTDAASISHASTTAFHDGNAVEEAGDAGRAVLPRGTRRPLEAPANGLAAVSASAAATAAGARKGFFADDDLLEDAAVDAQQLHHHAMRDDINGATPEMGQQDEEEPVHRR